MKKFFTTLALCAAMALQACWVSRYDVRVRIWRINETSCLPPGGYSYNQGAGMPVSFPLTVWISQRGFDNHDNPTIIKLQYAVYRKVGNDYVKVTPFITATVRGNGSAALPLTSDAKMYFGTVKIRPSKSIVRTGDYIIIRVWLSNGLIANADDTADINPELYDYTDTGMSCDSDLGSGWTPATAVCVTFNGKWGAR